MAKQTPREKIKNHTKEAIKRVHDKNIINHEGVDIELPSNKRLNEIKDKFFNEKKRKRSTNYEEALQKDVDGILKKIKVV
jgi:hypothetical protein